MLVGRDGEVTQLQGLVSAAVAGHGGALCVVGEPGVGVTALLDVVAAGAPAGAVVVRSTPSGADADLPWAGVHDVALPLRAHLVEVPGLQRAALEAVLGWGTASAGAEGPSRFLVAAGLLSLLSSASAAGPLLVVVDDADRLDPASAAALAFVGRRLGRDAVVLLAGAHGDPGPLAGLPRLLVPPLAPDAAVRLLAGRVAPEVVGPLHRLVGGNPLALEQAVASLGPEQRRGSARLPEQVPLGERLADSVRTSLAGTSPAGRRAVEMAACASGADLGPVHLALQDEGLDPDAALAAAERTGLLRLDGGRVAWSRPWARLTVAGLAAPDALRSAHRGLADALREDAPRQLHHLLRASTGYDDALGARVAEQARLDRSRVGHAAAAALWEQAAALTRAPDRAAGYLAEAAEDALLAGDGDRVRRLAAEVLAGPAPPAARARVLLAQGTLEELSGSVPRAAELLDEAVRVGTGVVRLRALGELFVVAYRLGRPDLAAGAADALVHHADADDPEQAAVASFCQGAALAFGGRWEEAVAPLGRAADLFDSDPVLREEPRYMAMALLAAGFLGDVDRAEAGLARRTAAARSRGALGVLPLVLGLTAAAAATTGRPELGYAWAGEAVELCRELGYVADLGMAHELLAMQEAARGHHDQADLDLEAAHACERLAGTLPVAVFLPLADAWCALCRGDLGRVVEVLEERLRADGGRQPRGEYPLSVVPDLVEAHLGLGDRARAEDLARQHADLHGAAEDPAVRADGHRLRGLVAADHAEADEAFVRALAEHARGGDPVQAARTRLLRGRRARRAGQRRLARDELAAAAEAFGAMGLHGWRRAADEELDVLGAAPRRGPAAGAELTSSETRVALLVAQGLSNRDIATSLFLSPKTVEHHVTSALRKHGVRSRTALAVALAGAATAAVTTDPVTDGVTDAAR